MCYKSYMYYMLPEREYSIWTGELGSATVVTERANLAMGDVN